MSRNLPTPGFRRVTPCGSSRAGPGAHRSRPVHTEGPVHTAAGPCTPRARARPRGSVHAGPCTPVRARRPQPPGAHRSRPCTSEQARAHAATCARARRGLHARSCAELSTFRCSRGRGAARVVHRPGARRATACCDGRRARSRHGTEAAPRRSAAGGGPHRRRGAPHGCGRARSRPCGAASYVEGRAAGRRGRWAARAARAGCGGRARRVGGRQPRRPRRSMHGLSVWGPPLDVVQVTRNRRRSGARRGTRVHAHSAPLSEDEIVVVDGVACTCLARTVVDLAREAPFEQAVISADAALRAGLERPALDTALRRARGWPGVPAARRAVAFADGRSESVGRVPQPRRDRACGAARSRAAVAGPARRIDGLHGLRLGAPADRRGVRRQGQVRPTPRTGPGRRRGGVRREAARGRDPYEDWQVVRWTWSDLRDFGPTAARIRARFASA